MAILFKLKMSEQILLIDLIIIDYCHRHYNEGKLFKFCVFSLWILWRFYIINFIFLICLALGYFLGILYQLTI